MKKQDYTTVTTILKVKEGKECIIKNEKDVYKMMKPMENEDREHFKVILLDSRNKVIGVNTVSIGTINSSLVHPREVYKPAILGNAVSIILVHNHPSGETEPSDADIEITNQLGKAGKILGIELLDHIIIGRGKYLSLDVERWSENSVSGDSK